MSREQYEAQFNSLSKAFSKAKRKASSAGGDQAQAAAGSGKTKDDMAHFVGMLMDLVGVFNKEDKIIDKSLPLDDPRMTFSMIFGGTKGVSVSGEEEEWSTDEEQEEDEDDVDDEEEDDESELDCPKLVEDTKFPSYSQIQQQYQQQQQNQPQTKRSKASHLSNTANNTEIRKVTEAEAEATAEELTAAETALEKRKI